MSVSCSSVQKGCQAPRAHSASLRKALLTTHQATLLLGKTSLKRFPGAFRLAGTSPCPSSPTPRKAQNTLLFPSPQVRISCSLFLACLLGFCSRVLFATPDPPASVSQLLGTQHHDSSDSGFLPNFSQVRAWFPRLSYQLYWGMVSNLGPSLRHSLSPPKLAARLTESQGVSPRHAKTSGHLQKNPRGYIICSINR